jgi:predicted acyl esterase
LMQRLALSRMHVNVFIQIRADIFRPSGDAKVPAILAVSPYGNYGVGTYTFYPGRRRSDTS